MSIATVSNVLNGKPSVAQAFVDRVRAAVDELGYAANTHAARLRSQKHSLVGVVVPDLSNPVFGAFVSTLERLAQADGAELMVVSAANDAANEGERLRAVRSWRPAGIIVIPCDGALAQRLPAQNTIPVVVADRIPDDNEFPLIAVDNGSAAAAIARHLVAEQYRSCLVAGSTLAISNVEERWSGFSAAAGAMSVTMMECTLDPVTIRERLVAALGARGRAESLFALDHVTAILAYRVLGELGMRAGRDIAFASFDETEWMTLVEPGITAVRQPIEAMAQAAWDQLRHGIAGDLRVPPIPRLQCAIAIRGSTLRTSGRSRSSAA